MSSHGAIKDTSAYPAPIHGWCCFHCGENFTTVGAARDHFGGNIYDTPGCMIRVQVGEERGLLMALRKAEEEVAHLRQQLDSEPERKWIDMRVEVQLGSYRAFRGCRKIQDVFHVYDSMEGRALAAEEGVTESLNGCRALLGLIQLIRGRDDLTPELREVLHSNHRIAEAEAVLAKASLSTADRGEPR